MMLHKFIKENKIAIINGLKWMSISFTMFILLIIFFASYINNQKPDLLLFIIVVLTFGIVMPFFCITVVFLRWWWDNSVTRRNFNSFPFSQLSNIGFEKRIINEGSKTKFISEYYSGKINGYIVDCDVDTQNENEFLRFNFYIIVRPLEKADFKRIQQELKTQNGFFDFDWISKKYHYKKHHLISVKELEKELIDFGKLLQRENFLPSDKTKS